MIRALAEIARTTDDTNIYVGDHRARKYRIQVNQITTDTPVFDRWDRMLLLGEEEMNLGNIQASITLLESAWRLCEASRFEPERKTRNLSLLAIAYFRLGETENCCNRPSPESCVYPLRGAALHGDEEGSRKAIKSLLQLLDLPGDKHARKAAIWLLNLAYMTLGEHPGGVPERYRLVNPHRARSSNFPRFNNVAEQVGLDRYSLAGGLVIDDFDGDGWFDLMRSDWDPRVGIQYHRNNGDGSFTNVTKEAGLEGITGGLNLKQGDYDNDGDLDILVLRGAWLKSQGRHPNSLLRNEGRNAAGHLCFTDVTFAVGLAERSFPTQTGDWADYDLDGDLDLFVGNEQMPPTPAYCQLFRNDGRGADGFVHFTPVGLKAGITNGRYTKGISWGDYNHDRYPDLYLSNHRGPNRLYRNNGDGTFTDVAVQLGVTGPRLSFPAWFWDYNNDGALDIFVSNYSENGNTYTSYFRGERLPDSSLAALYAGDGKGGFKNVVRETGMDVPMLPMGSNYGDLNNDGFPDVYLGTGTPNFAAVVPNLTLLNIEGTRFEDVMVPSGMGHLQKGHSVAMADLDRDGDLDVFEQMGGAYLGDPYYDALYENPGFGNHWLEVRLRGVQSDRFGIGARLHAVIEEGGVERSIYHTLNSGGSFGAHPLVAHLGIGQAERVKQLEVFWPRTGETQRMENIPGNQRIVVTEGVAKWKTLEALKPFSFHPIRDD
jgi:hypothetical protein